MQKPKPARRLTDAEIIRIAHKELQEKRKNNQLTIEALKAIRDYAPRFKTDFSVKTRNAPYRMSKKEYDNFNHELVEALYETVSDELKVQLDELQQGKKKDYVTIEANGEIYKIDLTLEDSREFENEIFIIYAVNETDNESVYEFDGYEADVRGVLAHCFF